MRLLTSLATTSFFSTAVYGITHDCTHIRAQGKSFSLEKLRGPHSVFSSDRSHEPRIVNTTWTLDICAPLDKKDDVPATQQCRTNTYVCGVRSTWNSENDPDKERVEIEPISIAGNMLDTGAVLEPYYLRLNKTDDHVGGLRVELNGGKQGSYKQKAIIDFLCDEDRSGNEGADKSERRPKRAEDVDTTNSLSYKSYGTEDNKDVEILRLEWKTKYVCENFEEDDDEEGVKKASWGFFTWFIVLLFLGVSAYLIFGSWLNYNRYGARGWDLLPHGDTIRDVPYIFKDFSRKVLDTFSGGGSRGGYSAV